MGLNKNKKELLSSGLSLALCGVLFAGATLAYFSKNVFSTDNIIKTSKLDVAFKYKDNNGEWKDVNGSIFNDVDKISANEKIEKEIQIINTGDLPFEYDIDIFRESEVNSLIESNISVKIEQLEGQIKKEEYNGALDTTLAAGNTELEGKSLLNKDKSHEYIITIAMTNTDKPLNADDYSNQTINPFDIQVRATQIEEDKKVEDKDNITTEKPGENAPINQNQILTPNTIEAIDTVVKNILAEDPNAKITKIEEDDTYYIYTVEHSYSLITIEGEVQEYEVTTIVKVSKELNDGNGLPGIENETPALQGIGYFYRSTSTGNIHVSVITGVELDLSKKSKDDIKIEYLKADGSVFSSATKNKTFYDEYLNKGGVKYPSSSNTILPVGEYSTTFNGNLFVKTKDVAGIRITVTNDGVSETITQYLR